MDERSMSSAGEKAIHAYNRFDDVSLLPAELTPSLLLPLPSTGAGRQTMVHFSTSYFVTALSLAASSCALV
jgi:hypothetical protein